MKKFFLMFLSLLTLLFLAGVSGRGFVFAAENAASSPAAPDPSPVPVLAQINALMQAYPAMMGKGASLSKIYLSRRIRSLRYERWLTLHHNLQDRQWEAYRKWMMSYRGGYLNRPSILMEATAYDPGPKSCGPYANGRTSTGMHAGYGVVAVDPTVIPLGTHLYIEGYGYAIAADIGSAIKGDRIDLCYNTYREAIQFGRRRVRVYLLDR